ncbi:MAG: hypothetical protein A2Y91_05215 [Chloroflexi bacterium RBG_13_54_8]|nr:MAG: hypothetical protein A2Y91_05215 [Chloroflexi bacterium RBG_13_54_8]
MPIYEYRCTRCCHQFELRRGFEEDSGAACPKCEGEAHRLFLPVPIIFKGTGFYITDSRAEKGGNGGGEKESKKEDGNGSKGNPSD